MSGKKFKRIVIKIGSSTLLYPGGKLNLGRIDHLLRQLVDLKHREREVLFVTSGAIGAGMEDMGFTERPKSIPEQQASAAIGQGYLMSIYNKFLLEYGEKGAQILLTASDLEDRSRYLNAFNTLETLLNYGFIPIVNENDTVVTSEIKFGDNDTLAARVAGLVEADLLLNLTDTDGLYDGNPQENEADLNVIHRVEEINEDLKNIITGDCGKLGTGGMATKLEAAEIASSSGITMVIGPGYEKNIIIRLVEMLEKGDDYNLGTTFIPEEDSLNKKKQWLYFNLTVRGRIIVDRGAAEALLYRKKSLLPGGIVDVKGSFTQGDLVRISTEEGRGIGKGLVNYSAGEIERIKGHHSGEIYSILGYTTKNEVIHRDNMVIKGGKK